MIIDYCQECGCSACLCGGPAMGIVPSWQDVADRWMKACIEHESTITDLRERHEAFVQAVRDAAYEACLFSSGEIHRNELLAIVDGCDAELGKEGK